LFYAQLDGSEVRPFESGGLNDVYLLRQDGQVVAIYKPGTTEGIVNRTGLIPGTQHINEVAAYRASVMLGLDGVPITTFVPGGFGSIQQWVNEAVPQTITVSAHGFYGPLAPELTERYGVFDYIIGNTDRHVANRVPVLGESGELEYVLIDNGLAFPTNNGSPIRSMFVPDVLNRPLSPELVEQLQSVDPKAYEQMLIETGISPEAATTSARRLREAQSGKIIGWSWGGSINDRPAVGYWTDGRVGPADPLKGGVLTAEPPPDVVPKIVINAEDLAGVTPRPAVEPLPKITEPPASGANDLVFTPSGIVPVPR
jgi:hypothetical protein